MIVDQLNRPLENLRISVTDRCNFRCRYCMPADKFPDGYPFLSRADQLTFEEIHRLAAIFSRLGVRKIRLTGGEPLVRRDLHKLVEMLASIDGIHDLAMTTNGSLLPQNAARLRCAGLQRLNISLDTLDDAVFQHMNGGHAHVNDILAGIDAAERAGFGPLKINTVVQRGVNDHTLLELALYFRARGHIVRFIEYMDAGTVNGWRGEHVVPSEDVVQRIHSVIPLEPLPPDSPGDVVQRYRYADGSGEIGVISSVSNPFCGGCNRLRLSADGKLYTCLFAQRGTDLRELLRSGADDDAIAERMTTTWRARRDRYSEARSAFSQAGTDAESQGERVEMYHIGG